MPHFHEVGHHFVADFLSSKFKEYHYIMRQILYNIIDHFDDIFHLNNDNTEIKFVRTTIKFTSEKKLFYALKWLIEIYSDIFAVVLLGQLYGEIYNIALFLPNFYMNEYYNFPTDLCYEPTHPPHVVRVYAIAETLKLIENEDSSNKILEQTMSMYRSINSQTDINRVKPIFENVEILGFVEFVKNHTIYNSTITKKNFNDKKINNFVKLKEDIINILNTK